MAGENIKTAVEIAVERAAAMKNAEADHAAVVPKEATAPTASSDSSPLFWLAVLMALVYFGFFRGPAPEKSQATADVLAAPPSRKQEINKGIDDFQSQLQRNQQVLDSLRR